METFVWPCDPADIRVSVEFSAIVSEFDVGPDTARAKGPPRRRWRLRFRKDQVDADAIWSFYVARRGSFEAFRWTNPVDNETYTVRFADDQLDRTALWRVLFEFGLEFIEVL